MFTITNHQASRYKIILVFLLILLHAVLRSALLATGHTGGIERTAHHVIPHAREILHASATDHDDRMFLKIVTLACDIGGYFHPVRDTYATNLPESGVRLLRSHGRHFETNSALEWAIGELEAILHTIPRQSHGRGFGLLFERCSPLFHQLIDCRHRRFFKINLSCFGTFGETNKKEFFTR